MHGVVIGGRLSWLSWGYGPRIARQRQSELEDKALPKWRILRTSLNSNELQSKILKEGSYRENYKVY